MTIDGRVIIDIGMEGTNPWVKLNTGQVLYLDKCERENIEDELKQRK
jgi:hypothetical protein